MILETQYELPFLSGYDSVDMLILRYVFAQECHCHPRVMSGGYVLKWYMAQIRSISV